MFIHRCIVDSRLKKDDLPAVLRHRTMCRSSKTLGRRRSRTEREKRGLFLNLSERYISRGHQPVIPLATCYDARSFPCWTKSSSTLRSSGREESGGDIDGITHPRLSHFVPAQLLMMPWWSHWEHFQQMDAAGSSSQLTAIKPSQPRWRQRMSERIAAGRVS